jgi:tetratricopeptide (TPR) repeat protein
LGVEALVEGSIERAGDRVRIRAQLIRASTDQHLWAESYDGGVSDLLSLEDRVARDIALQVAVNLTPDQERGFVRARTVNPDAYLDYLRGRYLWNQRTADGFEKALRYFQAAIDKNPNYAAAYAGLADTYLLQGGFFFRSQNETIPKARAAAQKALQIEDLAEAHATLGLIAENYDWDWPGAEKEFRLAIELNPNYSTAHHWYGEAFLAATGRFDEALAEMKRATELDPLSPIISTDLGVTLYLARRYDQAIQQLARTLELHPDYPEAQLWLARSYEQKKQCSEAISVLDHNKPFPDTLVKSADRARIYAECGRQTESLKILADVQRQASMRFIDPAIPGGIFIGLNRRNEALTQLERSVAVHSTSLTSLKVLPMYDPLRSDQRFAALLRTVHLSE